MDFFIKNSGLDEGGVLTSLTSSGGRVTSNVHSHLEPQVDPVTKGTREYHQYGHGEGDLMDVSGIGWMGVRSAKAEELVRFFQDVLSLKIAHSENEFWVFDLKDGSQIEVFGEAFPGKEHLTTGPVVGFLVDDLAASTAELKQHGVELLGAPGPSWQHFRGPDGHVYELKQRQEGHREQ
jgi:catechol 2,3-dioxygenase-like lactoylglutathione lyase family enzyme